MPRANLRLTPAFAQSPWPPWVIYPLSTAIILFLVIPLLPLHLALYYLSARRQPLGSYLATRVGWTLVLCLPAWPSVSRREQEKILPPPKGYESVDTAQVWIPVAEEVSRAAGGDGLLASPPQINPEPRPAFLLTPPGGSDALMIYFHGGGYVFAHALSHGFAHRLAGDTTRVLSVQYRLAHDDASAFPAQLLDAACAVLYAVNTLNVPMDRIVLCGDSAGGHLALATAQCLPELGLGPPGAMILCSPACDLDYSEETNALYPSRNDTLDRPGGIPRLQLAMTASTNRHYTADGVKAPPMALACLPPGSWTSGPVLVTLGGGEALRDEIASLVACMRRDGVDVRVLEEEGGTHNRQLYPAFGVYKTFVAGVRDLLVAMRGDN